MTLLCRVLFSVTMCTSYPINHSHKLIYICSVVFCPFQHAGMSQILLQIGHNPQQYPVAKLILVTTLCYIMYIILIKLKISVCIYLQRVQSAK